MSSYYNNHILSLEGAIIWMGDKNMKMTEENTEKNAELIMEETMKEIYDEVNRN